MPIYLIADCVGYEPVQLPGLDVAHWCPDVPGRPAAVPIAEHLARWCPYLGPLILGFTRGQLDIVIVAVTFTLPRYLTPCCYPCAGGRIADLVPLVSCPGSPIAGPEPVIDWVTRVGQCLVLYG